MRFDTSSSPHQPGSANVSLMMRDVIFALIPGSLLYCVIFNWGVAVNIAIAISFALLSEALVLKFRNRPIKPSIKDLSAIVTAWLFALSIPPLLPWTLTALGIIFAIVVAKHLYGGLGYNPFNPAMVGYVFLLISFPREMTNWPAPNTLAEHSLSLNHIWSIIFTNGAIPDAITMATPLDTIKTHLAQNGMLSGIKNDLVFGSIAGSGWEWVNLAWLGGGLWLMQRKIISWQIPSAMLGSLFLVTMLFYFSDPETHISPFLQCLSGAAILGAFFIATDPITAAASNGGRIIYACGIGIFIFIIRSWGGYPDGVAFAVLLMNMAVPTIDYFYRPKIYGQ